jgi:hypothetical protein
MIGSMPMRRLMRFPGVGASLRHIRPLMALANNGFVRGVAERLRRRAPRR